MTFLLALLVLALYLVAGLLTTKYVKSIRLYIIEQSKIIELYNRDTKLWVIGVLYPLFGLLLVFPFSMASLKLGLIVSIMLWLIMTTSAFLAANCGKISQHFIDFLK